MDGRGQEEEVELLLMKSLSLGLVKGSISGVSSTFSNLHLRSQQCSLSEISMPPNTPGFVREWACY